MSSSFPNPNPAPKHSAPVVQLHPARAAQADTTAALVAQIDWLRRELIDLRAVHAGLFAKVLRVQALEAECRAWRKAWADRPFAEPGTRLRVPGVWDCSTDPCEKCRPWLGVERAVAATGDLPTEGGGA